VQARPKQNVPGNVFGCGLLMDPDNKLTTFFTLNGILLGELFFEIAMKSSSQKDNKRISQIFIINLYIIYFIILYNNL
jgi:hypothetical protein